MLALTAGFYCSKSSWWSKSNPTLEENWFEISGERQSFFSKYQKVRIGCFYMWELFQDISHKILFENLKKKLFWISFSKFFKIWYESLKKKSELLDPFSLSVSPILASVSNWMKATQKAMDYMELSTKFTFQVGLNCPYFVILILNM